MRLKPLLLFIFVCICFKAYSQQDIDFHLNAHLLQGKNILKVKRDFHDPYLWVLAQNNQIFRINSLTNAIDDYTPAFSSFAGQQFFDIAGRSQDTVFVATSSNNVIEYKKGVISVIGAADGITGNVNSIGISFQTVFDGATPYTNVAVIGTDNSIIRYDCKTEKILPIKTGTKGKVFEATYRNEMLLDPLPDCRCFPDTVQHWGVIDYDFNLYVGEIWLGGNSFGQTAKSAFYTKSSAYGSISYLDFMNQFWATEKGLFQNNWDYSYRTVFGYNHYLKDVNITKITSIYGLLSFGSLNTWSTAKENILVATAQGLYFSNSNYQVNGIPMYNFTHYDQLGNVLINDICVNATSYTTPICEDGVWLATADGLYLIKPDYAKYITNKTINSIQFENQLPTVAETQICTGQSINAVINPNIYTAHTIQWSKDGHELPGETGTSLNITQSGDYTAVVYDPCSADIHFESNHLKVTIITAPTVTLNYPDVNNFCDGTTATFNVDPNPNFQYRWYKDGVLNGNTTNAINITQNGKYKLEVSACSGTWVSSKEIQVNFIKLPVPLLKKDKTAYCTGDQATLSIDIPTDASYTINWLQDGNLLSTATNKTSLITSSAGNYSVKISSNLSTCSAPPVLSNQVALNFITLLVPVIKPDKSAYCAGDQATLLLDTPPDGSYTINWLRDGVILPANTNQTNLITNIAGNYSVSLSNNITSCFQNSAQVQITFISPPTISLERIINTTLCDGQSVDLKATVSAGNVIWSTGEAGDNISVNKGGNYTATVTSATGCQTSKNIAVQFFQNPVIHLQDATLCESTQQQVTLNAPANFSTYTWNGQPGGPSFTTKLLGEVNLTVTDANGCIATQTINITSYCPDTKIANTFTPNGDGINDVWTIESLDNDVSLFVKVYNRYGNLVFSSEGREINWDGTNKGSKLPVGTYYYIITAKAGTRIQSGSVTIIY